MVIVILVRVITSIQIEIKRTKLFMITTYVIFASLIHVWKTYGTTIVWLMKTNIRENYNILCLLSSALSKGIKHARLE